MAQADFAYRREWPTMSDGSVARAHMAVAISVALVGAGLTLWLWHKRVRRGARST